MSVARSRSTAVHFPLTLRQRAPMEFVGQLRASEACNLLGVPGLSSVDMDVDVDVDDDECEVVIGIRPKSSPLPRRRSSGSDEDSEPEPPLSSSRRVSFADAKGLSLVQVKEFDTWDVPKLPECDSSEGEGKDAEEYSLSPLTFSLPWSTEELFVKVREQKVELESIELLPGTTILKGVVRVLNVSFNKAVYVRTTLDTWSSHFDLLTEYMPGSSDSLTDRFTFKLTLVPPFGEQGARVDFCLRYETPLGTFWANNNDRNYVLFCHQRVKERKETPQKEKVNKKSCLKTVGQNFSIVESISATEASSQQENISTEHGEEADTMKANQVSDGLSGTSEEDRQKLLTESGRNCSQRSRRKAARMARVRDYFSQRNGGADDTERDKSPPEGKRATQEETPEEKHSDVRSFPEQSSKSEGPRSEALLDVPHDASPALNITSNSEAEKSERINLADSLTGGESATDAPDNPSNDEPAPAECQNIYEAVSKAEESSQKQGSYECVSDIVAEPAGSVISAAGGKSLVSQTGSFTFGTVVAPLYHQVFGRVASESDPVRATPRAGDLTQSYLHAERRQTSCTAPTDARGDGDEVRGNVTQKSNQDRLDAAPNSPPMEEEEEEISLSATANNIPDHAETLQDADEIIHSDQSCTNTSEVPESVVVHPHTVNNLNTDLLNPQTSTESLRLRGEAQEDDLTCDLQLPEHTCTQTKTDLDETLAQPSQSASERVSGGSGANGCKRVHGSKKDDDVGKTVSISTTSAISEEDKPLQASHDMQPKHMNNSAAKGTENGFISCFEIVEEKGVTAPQISLETNDVEEVNKVVNNSQKDETKHLAEIEVIGEVAESMTKAAAGNHVHGDTFVMLEDEDTRKIERREMEAAVAKQEDFCLDEVNWEKMVEEEEKNILTDEEESEASSLKSVEKDRGQLEDAGRETASGNRDTAEDDMVEDILEGKQGIGEEGIGEIVAGKDMEEIEKEFEYVQATKTAGEEELAEETEVEKREEQGERESEKEKHFAEIQEVHIESTIVQDGEEMEGEEEMEVDLNGDDEAGAEDRVQLREGNVEEENPDYEEEILVDEIVDAESESMTVEDRENEAGCFVERLDITPNEVEDGLSALVDNSQDKTVADKDDGRTPTEMHLYEEDNFQSNGNATRDLSKAARDKSKSGPCAFADEPESDQTSHDSASAESDSDDEVELYMHCLRAVHAGAHAQKDRNKDAGCGVGKRPSVSRSKLPSTPMPSISESLDEEHFSRLPDNHDEDMKAANNQPAAAALPASSGLESFNRNVSWWKETFSCSNISKTLLYATLLVVFLVVAYRYDFLACFGLYLISLVWLYCQGERQPEQQKQRQNRL